MRYWFVTSDPESTFDSVEDAIVQREVSRFHGRDAVVIEQRIYLLPFGWTLRRSKVVDRKR